MFCSLGGLSTVALDHLGWTQNYCLRVQNVRPENRCDIISWAACWWLQLCLQCDCMAEQKNKAVASVICSQRLDLESASIGGVSWAQIPSSPRQCKASRQKCTNHGWAWSSTWQPVTYSTHILPGLVQESCPYRLQLLPGQATGNSSPPLFQPVTVCAPILHSNCIQH